MPTTTVSPQREVSTAPPAGTNAARSQASHGPAPWQSRDRATMVELEPAYKREYWALRLQVSERALREAVGSAGPVAEDVRRHLAARGASRPG